MDWEKRRQAFLAKAKEAEEQVAKSKDAASQTSLRRIAESYRELAAACS
jgi:hypothetical protein